MNQEETQQQSQQAVNQTSEEQLGKLTKGIEIREADIFLTVTGKPFPAIFIGQTKTRLVLGKKQFKIKMTYPALHEHPSYLIYEKETNKHETKPVNELEAAYYDFCQKADKILRTHPDLNGANFPDKIIFPDLTFEVIPERLPIE